MSTEAVNYAAEYAAIIAEAGTGREVFPKGKYLVKITKVSEGKTSTGKLKIGVMLVCVDPSSAYNGKSTWVNFYLTPKADSEVAYGIYIRHILSLGIPQSVRVAGPAPELLHTHIPLGTIGTAQLDEEPFNGEPNQKFKGFSTSTGAPAAAAPKPAPVVAQPVPVAVPVPAAPAAPVSSASEVDALKAQLAAMQAAAPSPAGANEEPF